jgi:large subunit ribosomal protein L17
MRHRIMGFRLSRGKDEREALRRNLVKELIDHERIQTTRTKAQAVRGLAERLITLAKRGNAAGDAQMVHARRLAAARLSDAGSVKKLFDNIAPRFKERPGGYTRIVRLGPRFGDSAEMVILELVEE